MEYVLGPVILFLLLITSSRMERRVKEVEKRLDRIERKLDAVIEPHGIVDSEPELAKVDQLLADGKKIEAIRAYRELTNAGLKETEDAIDARRNR